MHDYHSRSFSWRNGIEQDKSIQIGYMDDHLQTRIWNVIFKIYFTHHYLSIDPMEKSLEIVYDGFFKKDTSIRRGPNDLKDEFFSLQWNKVYDFVEFVLLQFQTIEIQNDLNRVLQEECAGYKIIDNIVTRITNREEIESVETAAKTGVQEVSGHIKTALQMLSDRENPDPRNSIKESISAIEALCKNITGDSSATLGPTVDKIAERCPELIDEHLRDAIKKLYKFSNDSSGVRHAMGEEKTKVDSDDARFTLVTCSAIVNYITAKRSDG